jgi:hypothetical protein
VTHGLRSFIQTSASQYTKIETEKNVYKRISNISNECEDTRKNYSNEQGKGTKESKEHFIYN